MLSRLVICAGLLFTSHAFASNNSLPENVLLASDPAAVQAGSYRSESGYFARVEIDQWANDLILRGYVTYSGFHWQPFEIELNLDSEETFTYSGQGNMEVSYNNGMVCNYPISVELFSYGDSFYIKSNHQQTICVENCTGCKLTQLVERRHEDPYILEEN